MSTLVSERPSSFRLAAADVHCWCVRLDAPPEAYARLHATLAADERERSARLRFPRDRNHFVIAHGVLRELLARYLQIPPGRIAYRHNRFGKPELDPVCGARLAFNLSHAGGLALIAVTAGSHVGVDLEYVRWRLDYAEIARRFFSTTELEQLRAIPSHGYAESFIGCWTKKEACLKAGGTGLAVPLSSFTVPMTTDPARGPEEVHMTSDIVGARRWSVYTLRPGSGYVGALAIEGSGWRLSERQWAEKELR